MEQLLKNQLHSSKETHSSEPGISNIPNGVLNEKSIKDYGGKGVVGKSSLVNDPTNNPQIKIGQEDIEFKAYKEEYVDLDDSAGSYSSYEDTLESSEGYIGDEKYLIVDFATAKSKFSGGDQVKSSKKMEEDSVYGKDGRRRRRRRYEEKSDHSSEEIVKPERVSLRERLRQKSKDEGLNSEADNSHRSSRRNAPQNLGQEENGNDSDDLYDERGRRRRIRREKVSLDEPPVFEAPSRRSELRRREPCETTTTSSEAATQPQRGRSEAHKRVGTDQTKSVERKFLSPLNAAMAEDDITQDGSKSGILSRLEELRRESSDSSGSDSGKKKKLVLKRGSMRRKKPLESGDSVTASSETSKTELQSGVRNTGEVTKENTKPVEIKQQNFEPCKQSEEKVNPKISERIEKINTNSLKQESDKNTSNIENKSRETIDTNIGIKSRIANLMASFNNSDVGKGKDVANGDTVANGTADDKAEIGINDVKIKNNCKDEDACKEEPKTEKKRKLVLKVKRKKIDKVNESKKETIETSPAKSRDLSHASATGKGEIIEGSKGGETVSQARDEIINKVNANAKGNKGVASGKRLGSNEVLKGREVSKGDHQSVKAEENEREKETKVVSSGYSNKVHNDRKETAKKENEELTNGKHVENGEAEINDEKNDNVDGTDKNTKQKKKKFVLKRKKK